MDAIRINKITDLYEVMPGAEMPPYEPGRGFLWGEVEGTPHWAFCEAIVDMIGREVNALASDHNLV